MELRVQGRGRVRLGRQHFVGQGAEGAVHARDGVAYKVYADPARALSASKLAELQAIDDPRVVKPEALVRDGSGTVVGYAMRHVQRAWPLARLFTRAFRHRVGLGPREMLDLVVDLSETVAAVHRAGVLIVDLNEFNVLVDEALDHVWLIDVDSYQTPSFPATALMDSIRDRRSPPGVFDEGTDWFSFAVTSFRMLIGVHPYRGKHPRVKSLDERMERDISVFDPDVELPPTALPLAVLPAPHRRWYEGVLSRGERLPFPGAAALPAVTVGAPVVPQAAGRAGALLLVTPVERFEAELRGVWDDGARRVVATAAGLHVDGARVADLPRGFVGVAFGDGGTRPVAVARRGTALVLLDLEAGETIPLPLRVDEAVTCEGRVLARCGERLVEIVVDTVGGRRLATTRVIGTVLANATRLFPGVAVQDLFGRTWVSLLEPGGTHQHHLPDLDGRRVVEARLAGNLLVVVTATPGSDRQDRQVFRFDGRFARFDRIVTEDVGGAGLDVLRLPGGVGLAFDEAGAVEVFDARPGATGRRRVEDARLAGGVLPCRLGTRAGFARGSELHRVSLAPGPGRAS